MYSKSRKPLHNKQRKEQSKDSERLPDTPLLDIKGLREVIKLIEVMKDDGRFPAIEANKPQEDS
jgi:hypothetical protein